MPKAEDLMPKLKSIIDSLRKVSSGDYVLSSDHNNVVDAISTLHDIVYDLLGRVKNAEYLAETYKDLAEALKSYILAVPPDQLKPIEIKVITPPMIQDTGSGSSIEHVGRQQQVFTITKATYTIQPSSSISSSISVSKE
ncbi:MAG: hypothetical protein DRP01_04640 [Archaeoglobales archaeon]|nr:MAG: hypothetical protein DRP01_04640 [Archaeoglobales archaeon]